MKLGEHDVNLTFDKIMSKENVDKDGRFSPYIIMNQDIENVTREV